MSAGRDTAGLKESIVNLRRDDIVERRLIEIRQLRKRDESGWDFALTYYCLDSGVQFLLPVGDADALAAEKMPDDAIVIQHPHIRFLYGTRIQEVVRDSPDSDRCQDTPYLLFSNGRLVTDVSVAPSGLDAARVLVFPPGAISPSKLVSFWKS